MPAKKQDIAHSFTKKISIWNKRLQKIYYSLSGLIKTNNHTNTNNIIKRVYYLDLLVNESEGRAIISNMKVYIYTKRFISYVFHVW